MGTEFTVQLTHETLLAPSICDLTESSRRRFDRSGISTMEQRLADLGWVRAGVGWTAFVPSSLGKFAYSGCRLWRHIRRPGIFLAVGERASDRLVVERSEPGVARRNLGIIYKLLRSVT